MLPAYHHERVGIEESGEVNIDRRLEVVGESQTATPATIKRKRFPQLDGPGYTTKYVIVR